MTLDLNNYYFIAKSDFFKIFGQTSVIHGYIIDFIYFLQFAGNITVNKRQINGS